MIKKANAMLERLHAIRLRLILGPFHNMEAGLSSNHHHHHHQIIIVIIIITNIIFITVAIVIIQDNHPIVVAHWSPLQHGG